MPQRLRVPHIATERACSKFAQSMDPHRLAASMSAVAAMRSSALELHSPNAPRTMPLRTIKTERAGLKDCRTSRDRRAMASSAGK